jgi:hypothetical protein
MPVYPDVEETDETSPYLLDLLDISNIDNVSRSKAIFKLKPINVSFSVFEKLFFKKRLGVYGASKLIFLDSLLNKLKPKLSRELRKYTTTACETIALNHEIFGLTLLIKRLRIKSLSYAEFIRILDTTNDTYVRVSTHLAINSISTNLTIEFIFRVKDIPCNPCAFDADDLFL